MTPTVGVSGSKSCELNCGILVERIKDYVSIKDYVFRSQWYSKIFAGKYK